MKKINSFLEIFKDLFVSVIASRIKNSKRLQKLINTPVFLFFSKYFSFFFDLLWKLTLFGFLIVYVPLESRLVAFYAALFFSVGLQLVVSSENTFVLYLNANLRMYIIVGKLLPLDLPLFLAFPVGLFFMFSVFLPEIQELTFTVLPKDKESSRLSWVLHFFFVFSIYLLYVGQIILLDVENKLLKVLLDAVSLIVIWLFTLVISIIGGYKYSRFLLVKFPALDKIKVGENALKEFCRNNPKRVLSTGIFLIFSGLLFGICVIYRHILPIIANIFDFYSLVLILFIPIGILVLGCWLCIRYLLIPSNNKNFFLSPLNVRINKHVIISFFALCMLFGLDKEMLHSFVSKIGFNSVAYCAGENKALDIDHINLRRSQNCYE